MKRSLKVLALTASMGKLAYVYLIGDELIEWEVSREAARSSAKADKYVRKLINKLHPDFIITEDADKSRHKGETMKNIIKTVTRTADHSLALNAVIQRTKQHKNKYREAKALTDKHPQLGPWLPKGRKCWEPEDRIMLVYEALALVDEVRRNK